MHTIDIIEAGPEDSERIARLLTFVQQLHADALPDWFKQPAGALFGLEDIEAKLRDERFTYLIARVAGADAAFALYEERRMPEIPYRFELHHLELHHIAVHPAFRRRGVATALINFVKKAARRCGASGIQLSVWAFNDASQSLFESQGFAPLITRYFKEIS